jgi:hypothetical protein
MIPLLKRFFHDLLYSPERATLWFRGVTTWIGVSAGLVVAYPPETIINWKFKDWAMRFVIAGVTAVPMMKKAGDRNRTDDEIRAVVADGSVATPISKTPPGAL